MKYLGLNRPKFTLAAATLLSLGGLISWLVMPRMEDPTIPERNAIIVTIYPGADPENVERLVADPIAEQLSEVEEVDVIQSTIRAEVAITSVELFGYLESDEEIENAWDEVRRALTRAQEEFPEGAGVPNLDTELLETETVLLAITGTHDRLALMEAAEKAKKILLGVNQIKNVKIAGDPGDQIIIEYDDALAKRLGITPERLRAQLSARALNLPGGALQADGKTLFLRPFAEFTSVDEIRATPIVLPSGSAIPLGDLANIRRAPAEPVAEVMRHNLQPAIALGVVPVKAINLVGFGELVRDRYDVIRDAIAPLTLEEITYQPQRVKDRLSGLNQSLMLGIGIVTLVLVSAMGFRLGLIVAGVVPLISFTAIAVFNFSGGLLQQMSIAALVIALGLLVDNAIVISEAVQWHLDRGKAGLDAARLAIGELALPLLAATGTTLAAFVPMLLAEGNVGSFTRDIPRVIMITLAISYFFALFITPFLAAKFQRPRAQKEKKAPLAWLTTRLAALATGHPRKILMIIGILVLIIGISATGVRRQFFPYGDRNQLVATVYLPEGSHLNASDQAAKSLEIMLRDRPDVRSVTSFIGRSTPQFYYNLPKEPRSPHLAQILIQTRSQSDLNPLAAELRAFGAEHLPDAVIVPRVMEQGPPIDAPIEIRVFSENWQDLQTATETVHRLLRPIEGAFAVRHDLGLGLPTVRFQVDDAAAARHGLARADVALALFRQTRGLSAGEFRYADDPAPILIRAAAGESLSTRALEAVDIGADRPGARTTPLGQIAHQKPEWTPSVIQQYERRRVATVSANLEPGATFEAVLATFNQASADVTFPPGVDIEFGGAYEASVTANMAIVSKLPYTLVLLIFILLAEFNSFRNVTIIMATIPLAAAGVIPGLLLSNQPFGFMSLLGVLALAGIVVNNAIVLIEVIEAQRKTGLNIAAAVSSAIAQRTRPILLTTATTVAGLLPLAFSSSSLWPPMAWAMISGLLSSTALTLLAAPAAYMTLYREQS